MVSGLLVIIANFDIILAHIGQIGQDVNRKPKKVFKINDIVELRLINNTTYIYIKGKEFLQCMYLLLNIPKNNIEDYDDFKNIDEIAEHLDDSLEDPFIHREHEIDSKTEFIGHCSNIQAFFENGLNTDILHSNIAFPLLKELVKAKYKPAYFKFREEIVRRYNEGDEKVRCFLYIDGYLDYLKKEDLECLDYDDYKKFIDSDPYGIWKPIHTNDISDFEEI